MYLKTIAALLLLIGPSCSGGQSSASEPTTLPVPALSPDTITTIQKIPLPAGYKRISHPLHSFAGWLRDLPLKEDKTVYLYNGQLKRNQSAQFAVLDVSVGNRDLQQCADAVMRLRAEYLFERQQYSSLLFITCSGSSACAERPL
ncbi:MAG: hypothetical protein EOO06_20895 [Chitinophagaceae bacterium]|nr:MAG: hypothetical protein EOO06_20895 [Chitinophagaceae bacterium]